MNAHRSTPLTTVLLIGDQPELPDPVRTHIDEADDLSVIAGTHTGAADVARLRPDVVLLDTRRSDNDGTALTRAINRTAPGTQVLVLHSHCDQEHLTEAMSAGVAGYVTTNTPPRGIIDAIRVVAGGGMFLDATVAEHVRRRLGVPATPAFPQLTAREQEILHLLARDADTAAIARQLDIAAKTVRNHVSKVLVKLPAATRAEAVRIARQAVAN